MIDRDPDATIGPVRRLAEAVVATAVKDALKGKPISQMGLGPWIHLAGLRPDQLPEALAQARDGRLAERLDQDKEAAKREQQARVGRPRGRPKGSLDRRGVNAWW